MLEFLTVYDYLIVIIVVCSIIVSWYRGLVTEIVSLCSWFLIVMTTWHYGHLPMSIIPVENDSLKWLGSHLSFMGGAWVSIRMLRRTLNTIVRQAGLKEANHLLGLVWGTLRGLLFVSIGVFCLGFTSLPQKTSWQKSLLLPSFEQIVLGSKPWLPAFLQHRIHYEQVSTK